VAPFSNEVCDYPVLCSLLEMLHGECRQFCSPQAASQEDCDRGIITLDTNVPIVEDGKKFLALCSCRPVSNSHAAFLDAFHAPDRGCEIRTEQSQSAAS
jgi:hypothetical protein